MKQILLIEDNEDHAELIQRSLNKGLGNIDVVLCKSAKAAYRILEKNHFDLILCDYYLPDSKEENHIRQLYKITPETPIVVITGQGDEKIAARSIKAGAEDYVVKTRDALAALPSILKRAMAKHRSHQSKKKQEINQHLQYHKRTAKKVLGEVEAIRQKMSRLKKKYKPKKALKLPDAMTLENLTCQVESLKKFVKKMLLGSK